MPHNENIKFVTIEKNYMLFLVRVKNVEIYSSHTFYNIRYDTYVLISRFY